MRIERIDRFTKERDTFEWLIKDLLANVGWTLLFGAPGLGKTTFAVQMGACLTEGKPFLGRQVKQTSFLYIQADSGEVEWRRILNRVAKNCQGYTVVNVPNRVLGDEKAMQWIKEKIEKIEPGFIVFDSFYNLSPWNFNTEQAVQAIDAMRKLALLGEQEIPFLLVHHPPQDADRPAGHHSIMATCSNTWGIMMRGKGRFVFEIQKSRYRAMETIPLAKDDKTGVWKLREEKGKSDLAYDPMLDD